MFETTRIPDIWVQQCNKMDAILVPCQWNKEVFENSGVKVPVRVATPALGETYYDKTQHPTVPRVIKEFCFYSIFQWTERKAPLKLIEAYWKEFSGNKDVRLVLKAYRRDYSSAEFDLIKKELIKLKIKLKLDHYPQIVPIFRKLSSQEITNLHLNNDCFVLPHRAEGWGLPHMEAMAFGRPVIATGFSGNMDFMTKHNSFLVKNYKMVPVGNMEWIGPWYDEATMQWADPDMDELMAKMRYVYEHQEDALKVGQIAQNDIHIKFTQEACGEGILEVIEELYKGRRKKYGI
jgi:glycosyltransferase involved in cell wall biosynthesis